MSPIFIVITFFGLLIAFDHIEKLERRIYRLEHPMPALPEFAR